MMTIPIDTTLQIGVTLLAVGIAWGTLRNSVKHINDSIRYIQRMLDSEIKPDLKNVRERFIIVEERVNTLWKDRIAPQGSSRQLNELGVKILNGSGVKEIVDRKKDVLMTLVKKIKPRTAYDADQAIVDAMTQLPIHCPDLSIS